MANLHARSARDRREACRVAECVTIPQLHRQLRGTMKFNDVKSDTLNLRVSPSFKLALKAAADHDQRSMVNMLEVLVATYCDTHRIAVPEEGALDRPVNQKPWKKAP